MTQTSIGTDSRGLCTRHRKILEKAPRYKQALSRTLKKNLSTTLYNP
jgi:hypothetical protein